MPPGVTAIVDGINIDGVNRLQPANGQVGAFGAFQIEFRFVKRDKTLLQLYN